MSDEPEEIPWDKIESIYIIGPQDFRSKEREPIWHDTVFDIQPNLINQKTWREMPKEPEKTRDMASAATAAVLIAILVAVAIYGFGNINNDLLKLVAFVPLLVAAAGVKEFVEAIQLKPREKE